jgi:hypothetical protein
MLFCAASPSLYSFFTTEAYPSTFFPFPPEVDAVPDFSTCNSDNERETLKATNARDQKTRADIVTNAALSDVFLMNLPKAIHQTYEPICMKQPNTVFLHMFNWFIEKYGKTTTEDRKDNRQRMAADWHPSDGFEPLATRLFVGASYTSASRYPMDDRDVIDIGLRVIKRCGMYSEEYKNWITRENESPPIVETIDSFKEYWAAAISLVNQTAIPAANHGYGMNVMDDDTSIASYGESLANFGAAYAAMQESTKSKQPPWLLCRANSRTSSNSAWLSTSNPRPTSTPLHSNSSTTIAVATGATVALAVQMVQEASHNNQPGSAATVPARNSLRALPRPTSVGRIGITAAPMVATSTTPTQA